MINNKKKIILTQKTKMNTQAKTYSFIFCLKLLGLTYAKNSYHLQVPKECLQMWDVYLQGMLKMLHQVEERKYQNFCLYLFVNISQLFYKYLKHRWTRKASFRPPSRWSPPTQEMSRGKSGSPKMGRDWQWNFHFSLFFSCIAIVCSLLLST